MAEATFATPEEAAVADFPPQYVNVESVTYSTMATPRRSPY
jgi:hypothetical protein